LKITRILIVILLLCSFVASSQGQETALSIRWTWNDGPAQAQGKESSVTMILSNTGKGSLKLEFVGLHFPWMRNDTYLYGGGSEKNNTLSQGQSITYTIPFGIPKNLTAGQYKCYAYISYYVAADGSWTKMSSAYYPQQTLEIVPMVVVTVTSTTTLSQPEDWTVDFAVLLAFTIVGLALLATFRLSRRKNGKQKEEK
jgi:hypothetical protein